MHLSRIVCSNSGPAIAFPSTVLKTQLKVPSGQSTRCCPTVSYGGTVCASPFAEGSLRESAGVTLSPVHVPEDYQCQRLLDIIVAVHLLRDRLADHVERSRHYGDSLGIVVAVNLNQTQHHTSPLLGESVMKLRHPAGIKLVSFDHRPRLRFILPLQHGS